MNSFLSPHNPPVIEPEELAQLIETASTGIRLFDASVGPQAKDTFNHARIAGTCFFDIETIADTDAPFPHTAPSPEQFTDCMRSFGLNNNDIVVVYDQSPMMCFAAARAWWLLKLFGHEQVYILNGGLPAWQRQGLATESGLLEQDTNLTPSKYQATMTARLATFDDIESLTSGNNETALIDTRPAPAFMQGHIEGAINIPFEYFLDTRNGGLKSREELVKIMEPFMAIPHWISTCNSGVTSCLLAVVGEILDNSHVKIYDGSWTEYKKYKY